MFAILNETFEQVCGIYLDNGTPLFESFTTVSPEETSRPMEPGCASIAARVEHVRFYLEVLDRCLRPEAIDAVDFQSSWQGTSVTPEEGASLSARCGRRSAP